MQKHYGHLLLSWQYLWYLQSPMDTLCPSTTSISNCLQLLPISQLILNSISKDSRTLFLAQYLHSSHFHTLLIFDAADQLPASPSTHSIEFTLFQCHLDFSPEIVAPVHPTSAGMVWRLWDYSMTNLRTLGSTWFSSFLYGVFPSFSPTS